MTTETKTFAFKLAKSAGRPADKHWRARPGVATAGCTLVPGDSLDYRNDIDAFGNPRGRDNGYYC